MMRRLLVVFLAAVSAMSALAVEADSVSVDASTCMQHRFTAKQLIAPGAMICLGAFMLIDHEEGVNEWVSDAIHGGDFKMEDYTRFVPSVAYLTLGSLGVKGKHNFRDRALVTLTSHAAMALLSYGMKYTVHARRPDGGEHSFPSGHVALAFTGAELTRIEYGNAWGAAAYAVATSVAVLRLYNDRHYFGDVLAGAGIGILSAHIGYWLLPLEQRWFHLNPDCGITVAAMPAYDPIARAPSVSFVARF